MPGEFAGELTHRENAGASAGVEAFFRRSAPAEAPAPRLRWASDEHRQQRVCLVAGRTSGSERFDDLLGTNGRGDDDLLARMFDQFGTDGFGRLRGDFAVALWDAEGARLVLGRAGSGSVPLYVRRGGGKTRFATELRSLVDDGDPIDVQRLRAWVHSGRWSDLEATPYPDIESIAPGTALVITAAGRAKRQPFSTFAPFDIPRGLSLPAATAELTSAVAESIEHARFAQVAGDSPAAAMLARILDAGLLAATTDDDRLDDAAAAAEHPLPYTALQRLTTLDGATGDLATDWGAREALGGTITGAQAWLRSLAAVVERDPNPKNLALVLRHGVGVSRSLPEGGLAGALESAGTALALRWSASVPSRRLQEAVERRFDHPAASDVEPVTGDPFTDLRFAECRSRHLEVLHVAGRRLLAARGLALVAPFLDPAVVERIFSYPPGHFLGGGRTMLLVGGEEVAETARQIAIEGAPPPRLLEAADALLGGPRPQSASRLDRWAGIGAWCLTRGRQAPI